MKRVVLALCLFPVLVLAADEEQLLKRIDELEARIEQLERRLGADGQEGVSTSLGQVTTCYWLTQASPFNDKTLKPLREGQMPLSPLLALDPAGYGIEEAGLFSNYRDPSRYPAAALAIEGELWIAHAGTYRVVFKATPPREVGGAGNVQVQAAVSLGSERFDLPLSSSLAPRHKEVVLPAGRIPLSVEILALSPGFGPPPTGTQVFIGMQAPGAIRAVPLSDYLTPNHRE